MVELSEQIFQLETRLDLRKAELAEAVERERQASIRTSTARRFRVSDLDQEATQIRVALTPVVLALQSQLDILLSQLPTEEEVIEVTTNNNFRNIAIIALIGVGAILILR